MTLVDLLLDRAARTPTRHALTLLADGEEETARWTYQELHLRAAAFAERLSEQVRPGDPVVLFADEALPFIAAFFGCLYAGAIPTPLHPPNPSRLAQTLPRLQAILADARPRAFIMPEAWTRDLWPRAAPHLADLPALPFDAADAPTPEPGSFRPTPHPLALLQYTSGSTGTPKGVVVSHANLLQNHALAHRAIGFSEDSVVVSWLPLFHDMGLIGKLLQPLYSGCPTIVMPPTAFLRKPHRWLRAISRYRGTLSAAPNFAYDLCVQRVTEAQRAELDLSSWRQACNGAEPVRPDTLDAFCRVFEPHGFRRSAFYPLYGLAEATLFVAGGKVSPTDLPRVLSFDAAALERGEVVPVDPAATARRLAASGRVDPPLEVVVVDPATLQPLPPGRVGELWLRGPRLPEGYWRRPEETAQTFRATLADDGAPHLRTGDLGFVHDEHLFVVGRLKDLIIVRGRNHHPGDLERTAEEAVPALRRGCSVAFGVDVDGEERVVLVVEAAEADDRADLIPQVKEAVAAAHGVPVHDVVVLPPGQVLKTSSGKLRRRETRAAWLAGTLEAAYAKMPPGGASG
jgi:acyl-CoA synthetase (AMP-forming)/AMP-acid ligase II